MNLAKKFYEILGVNEKSNADDLRRAYFALAAKHHPDRNPGDQAAEERFKDISQAYAVLSDPSSRAHYDRLRLQSTIRKTSGGYKPRPDNRKAQSQKPAQNHEKPSADKTNASESDFRFDEKKETSAKFNGILNNFFKTAKGRAKIQP